MGQLLQKREDYIGQWWLKESWATAKQSSLTVRGWWTGPIRVQGGPRGQTTTVVHWQQLDEVVRAPGRDASQTFCFRDTDLKKKNTLAGTREDPFPIDLKTSWIPILLWKKGHQLCLLCCRCDPDTDTELQNRQIDSLDVNSKLLKAVSVFRVHYDCSQGTMFWCPIRAVLLMLKHIKGHTRRELLRLHEGNAWINNDTEPGRCHWIWTRCIADDGTVGSV